MDATRLDIPALPVVGGIDDMVDAFFVVEDPAAAPERSACSAVSAPASSGGGDKGAQIVAEAGVGRDGDVE